MELTHLASGAPPWARSVAIRTRISRSRPTAGPAGAAGSGLGHALRGVLARVVLTLAGLATAAALATALAPSALAADPPVAKIVITGTVHFADQEVAFADESTGEPDSRTWTFGDGDETSTRRHPTHTYHDPGTYTVTLTVVNAAGTDVATATISILGEWTGGVQVYRAGAYSKQATMRLCVAASVQMMRNMVYNQSDHSLRYQSAYNAYGRAHNGYVTPPAAGVDPAGMQATLRRYVHPELPDRRRGGLHQCGQGGRAGDPPDRPAGQRVRHGRATCLGDLGLHGHGRPGRHVGLRGLERQRRRPVVRRPPGDQRLRPGPERDDVGLPVRPLPDPVPRPVRAEGLAEPLRGGHPVRAVHP